MRRYVPFWALQFATGALLVVIVAVVAIAAVSSVAKVPSAFFDQVGRTVHGMLPKEGPDVSSDDQLRAIIRSMPEGKLRVGSVIAEDDVVVFTVTAQRSAVRAAVVPGDQLRLSRDTGQVEVAPQGLPGVIDELQRRLDELRKRFFGP